MLSSDAGTSLLTTISEDTAQLGKKARLWAKKAIERESSIIGDADEDSIFPADFIIPHENTYATSPPVVQIDLRSLDLLPPTAPSQATPVTGNTATPTTATTASSQVPSLVSQPAKISFGVSVNGEAAEEYSFPLSYDIHFVTAHPCAPSHRVTFLKSPSSPTIQQIDVTGSGKLGKSSRSAHRTGK